jgi:LacI family transcriptional regulator
MSFFSDSAKNQGTILSVEIPGTGRQVIEEKMNQIIEENQNLGAILVSSSKTHVIARYLEQKKFNPILIGYEITPQNTDYLKKGIIDFLIGQKPMEQSEKAVKRLFEYLTSHTISQKHEFQPLEIINSETIAVHQNNDF